MLTVRVQTRPAPLKEACRGQRSTQSNRCALRRGGRGGNGRSTKGVLFSSGRPKRKFMCRAAGDDSEASNGTAQAEDAEQRKYWGPPPEERDEDGLYIGEYSNLFTDSEQLKGIVIFCAFLASFFAAGNVLTTVLLSLWFGQAPQTCWQEILLGYPCDL